MLEIGAWLQLTSMLLLLRRAALVFGGGVLASLLRPGPCCLQATAASGFAAGFAADFAAGVTASFARVDGATGGSL